MRLNAVTVLFGAVLAAAFPSRVKHDAVVQAAPVPVVAQEPVAMPEFVSLTNFSEFLLAAERASVSPDTREAAEALSAKFARTATASASDSEFLRVVVHQDPVTPIVFGPAVDPKSSVQASAPQISVLSEDRTSNEPVTAPSDDGKAAQSAKADVSPAAVTSASNVQRKAPRLRKEDKKTSLAREGHGPQRRQRLAASDKAPKRTAAAPESTSSFDRLIGFVGLAPDNRLAN